MSAGLPQQIDVRRFAESGRHLEGEVLLEDCPRLNQITSACENPVAVVLDFEKQPGSRLVIHGNVHGQVILECQRCLEPATIDLDCEVSIGVVGSEAEAELLPDELDPVIVEDELNLIELIEDELLLALPIVPVHEHCDLPQAVMSGEKHNAEPPKRENPFAVLASLKKDK
jgi:uncharacterized protein